MCKKIILIGGGGHCKSCIDVIESGGEFEIIGIIDSNLELKGKELFGYKFLGDESELKNLRCEVENILITVGQIKTSSIRVKLFNILKEFDFKFPIIKSKHAIVSKYAKIDEGTIIMHGVIVNASAKIGKNCIINSKALIEHDVSIGDFCHISTGACINGGVVIGEHSFIGSNSVFKQYINIAPYSIIQAGATILNSTKIN